MRVICEIVNNFSAWSGFSTELEQEIENICLKILSNFDYLQTYNLIELSLMLTSDQEIKKLNKIHRAKEVETNILSFPAFLAKNDKLVIEEDYSAYLNKHQNPLYIGDLAVSYETFILEAEKYNWNKREYFIYLFVHGFLHLLGMQHDTHSSTEKMEEMEKKILANLGIESPY